MKQIRRLPPPPLSKVKEGESRINAAVNTSQPINTSKRRRRRHYTAIATHSLTTTSVAVVIVQQQHQREQQRWRR